MAKRASKQFTVQEPRWNTLAPLSKMEMANALNYYNVYHEAETKKKWAISYLKEHAPGLVAQVQKAPMHSFGTFAVLARMISRGAILEDRHHAQMMEYFQGLGPKKQDEEETPKKVATPKKPKVNALAQEFDDSLDEAIQTYKEPKFTEVGDTRALVAICERELEAIAEEDGAYPRHMKKWFKKALEVLGTRQKIRKTVVRKPRKIDPAKMARGVKTLMQFDALGLSGLQGKDLVGKKKVYVYNTKYRKLFRFVAAADMGFVFKPGSSTLLNVDMEKSSYKLVGRPQEMLRDKMGIRELDRLFNSVLKGKDNTLTGSQLRPDYIILQVS